MNKGSSWISSYLPIQEELENLCCSELKDTWIVAICLRHVKTIVRD